MGSYDHSSTDILAQTGKKRVLFDAVKDGQNVAPKWVAPEDEQEPNESRRSVRVRSADWTVGYGRGACCYLVDRCAVVGSVQCKRSIHVML